MTTQATTPLPEEPAEPRRLTRSSTDRVIAGVAGGIGRYFGVDPVVVRIAFVVLTFFGGAGFIGYAVAWLLVPSDKDAVAASYGRDLARRLGLVLLVLFVSALLAFGGAWAAALGGGTAVAIAVIAAGALLIIGGFVGGTRWLVLPALALALPAGLVAAANVDARGGAGERIYRPAGTADLRRDYKLGVGHLVVDLRATKLGPGDHRIHLKLGIGGAEVLVRPDVCVSSSARIGVGATQVFDRQSGGADVDWQDGQSARAGSPRLIVDADVGLGAFRVQPAQHGEFAGNAACAHG